MRISSMDNLMKMHFNFISAWSSLGLNFGVAFDKGVSVKHTIRISQEQRARSCQHAVRWAWGRRPCRPAVARHWHRRPSVWTAARAGLHGRVRVPVVRATTIDPPCAHPSRRTPPPSAPATPILAPARRDSATLWTIGRYVKKNQNVKKK